MQQKDNEDYKKRFEEEKKKNDELRKNISAPTYTPSTSFSLQESFQNLSGDGLRKIFDTNIGKDFEESFKTAFDGMENAAMRLATKFGGSRDMVTEIKKTIDLATPSVMALGGSMEDVVSIQKGVIDALQRQVVLDKESFADMYSISSLISEGGKASAESTKKLVSNFKDLGYSIYDITKQMGGVINMARDMGVATDAVYSQLSENVGKLNLYNFDNGIKGMAKMAAEAASLRLNMKDTFDFAEKVFKPEDALQMAAGMQRLGISVSNLLDPFKMMDMAQNRPEELQKSLMEAAQEFIRFDKEQGRFIVSDNRRLREYADLIGKSADEVARMGINFADMERKLSVIDFGKQITSEEDKKFFAGLAELKDGKYLVNIATDGKDPVMKEISELRSDEIERLRRDAKEKEKAPAELQRESLHSLKRLELLMGAMVGLIPRHMAASAAAERIGMEVEKVASPLIKGTMGFFGVKEDKGRIDIGDASATLTKKGNAIIDSLMNIIKDPEKGIEGALKGLSDTILKTVYGVKNANETINGILKSATEYSKKEAEGRGDSDFIDFKEGMNNFFNWFETNVFSLTPTTSNAATSTNTTTTTNAGMTNPINNPSQALPLFSPQSTNQNTATNQTNVSNTTNGMQSFSMDNIGPSAAGILLKNQEDGLKNALRTYANSPALSVSLWGDNIGLTKGVKEVKEGIDKSSKEQKDTSDNTTKQTMVAVKAAETKQVENKVPVSIPTEETKDNTKTEMTSTNINYGDVLNNMSSGKLSENTINNIEKNIKESSNKEFNTLSENSIKILEKNRESSSNESFVNKELIEKSIKEKINISDKNEERPIMSALNNLVEKNNNNLFSLRETKDKDSVMNNLVERNSTLSTNTIQTEKERPIMSALNNLVEKNNNNLFTLRETKDNMINYIPKLPQYENTKKDLDNSYNIGETTVNNMSNNLKLPEFLSSIIDKSSSFERDNRTSLMQTRDTNSLNTFFRDSVTPYQPIINTQTNASPVLNATPNTPSFGVDMREFKNQSGLNNSTSVKFDNEAKMELTVKSEGLEGELAKMIISQIKGNPYLQDAINGKINEGIAKVYKTPKGKVPEGLTT